MQIPPACGRWLAAASIVVAFGGLFIGRLMIYPVAKAEGKFLQRVAAESTAWDHGHRVMLLGMLFVVPAVLALRQTLHARSPLLTDVAATLAIAGAGLGIGQYALDFAMLAAARIEPAQAGEQFLDALQADTFVQWAFYKLPDLAQLALILFAIALWRQGHGWRLQAILVSVAAATSLIAPQLIGAMGVRIALGLWFLGFTTVAAQIVRTPAPARSADRKTGQV